MKGRVAVAPSDVRVHPPLFRSRRTQALLLAFLTGGAILGYLSLVRTPPTGPLPQPPQVRIELQRAQFARGETVQGSVVITARDATRLTGVAVAVYAEGVSQSPGNEVVKLALEAGTSSLAAGQSVNVPLTWNQEDARGNIVARGNYVLVASVQSETSQDNQHVIASGGSAAGVRLHE